MAKSKKGPRQAIGLQCTVCRAFGYVSSHNRNNELLKKQTTGESIFPLNKYCKVCRKRTPHRLMKKLK